MYNYTNPKSKQYSRIKSLFVILERSIKYFFYSFIILISFFKFRAKKKTVLNLGSLEDSRFINFLIFSLKDRFVFSFNLNQNILALIKKIGIKNFLKFFYPRFLLKKKDKILSITLNKKMNSALSEIDFDTDYFSFVTKKKEILKNHLVMPYYLYPRIYNHQYSVLKDYLLEKKLFRIVFSGSIHSSWYGSFNWTNKDGQIKMLNRNEIIDFVIREFKSEIYFLQNYQDISNAQNSNKKIIFCLTDQLVTKQRAKLSNIEHLKFISKSNFFLTAPGTGMPLCHHLIEAIKFGSIPITSYGHLLYPSLTNMNSVSFHDYKSLHAAIEKSLLMKDSEITEKQDNLLAFYKKHLSPESFSAQFDNIEGINKIICCNDHESVYRYYL